MTATTTRRPSRRPSRRLAKVVAIVSVPAAVVVSGLVVSQASYSAYSATTVNPTSNWATGLWRWPMTTTTRLRSPPPT